MHEACTKDNSADLKMQQKDMHRDFFDRAQRAVDSRFYLEAIFLEYAAIEGRLEVILGILGFPCSKELDKAKKSRVNISDRIECLRCFRNENADIFAKSNLPGNFFTSKGTLNKWIKKRNTFVHGLFKNESDFSSRTKDSRSVAQSGLQYSKLLYNEAKRLRRLLRSHPDMFKQAVRACQSNKCSANEHK